jgi:DNA polymerase III delta prime subunit
VLGRTSDDFGITISSNKLTDEVIKALHTKIQNLHRGNIELLQAAAEAGGEPTDGIQIDPDIHLKRLAI